MTSSSLFLDTSIQISRKGNDANEIKKIEDTIAQHDFISTSSYVRLEFKQSYIQDLVYLHRNLVLERSIARVMQKVKGLTTHPGHIRKLSVIMDAVIGYFVNTRNFHSDSFDRDFAEQFAFYLEIILEDIWNWFNEESVDYISDAIGCIRSKEPPTKKTLTFNVRVKKCKSQKIRCSLNKFFKKKEAEFRAIRGYINSLDDAKKGKPDELKKIVAIIDQGLANPDSLCNSRECRGLGDALVVVEATHFKKLFTKDKDQAEVICKAISLKASLLS